jgi:hypothetical protein
MQKIDKKNRKRKEKNPDGTQAALLAMEVANFELLENRQMMSATVNVGDFGAKPNDGQDDTAAVMAAVNASKAGDTILFSGGSFNFSGEIDLPSDRNYLGSNNASLNGRGSQGELIKVSGDNVSFKNLTFNGGGIFLDKAGGMNTNVTIDHDVFNLNTSGTNPNGITATSGLQNSTITNNHFSGYAGAFGIYGYNYNNLKITNNEFVNISAGIHIQAFGNSGNLLVQNNFISGVKGMGMEFQGSANNLKFLDNVYEHPVLSSNASQNTNSMAFSLPLDASTNVDIERNMVIAPERADGIGTRIGIETGGDNTLVQDNYFNGVNCTIADTDGSGSSSVIIRNNREQNFLQGDTNVYPGGNHQYTDTNNGPNVQLTWDINRSLPGVDKNAGGGTSTTGGTQNPTPAPDPTPTPTPAPTVDVPVGPTGLTTIVTGSSKVVLFWNDNASKETGYIVESSTDGQTWTQLSKLPADSVDYTATGLAAGKTYQFRVAAYNDGGNSAYSNVATATPNVLTAANGATYLSDLTPTEQHNGWGQMQLDTSNGEQGKNDGHVLTIGGKGYDKGLGVHAGSEVHYQLDGKYSTFVSDIGVDDETALLGSVDFQVWADGVKLYDSGTVTGADGRKSVSVDVSGKKELTLIVTDAGDGKDSDHADWANARLFNASTPAPTPTPAPAPDPGPNSVFLSDQQWTSTRNGWGPAEMDQSVGDKRRNDGKTLTINGTKYAKGIGAHSNSTISYALNGKYSTFTADVGVDDEVGNAGSVVFQVWADGKKLFDSGTMTGKMDAKSVTVDVTGKKNLSLVVTNAGDGFDSDHADWANAKLTLATAVGQTPVSSTAVSDMKMSSDSTGDSLLDASIGNEALRLDKTRYDSGIGTTSGSKLVYNLNGKYTTFTSDIGIDDETGALGSADFQVWADGKMVYDSGIMTAGTKTKSISVNVAGAKQMWLVVTDGGNGASGDHTDWANAQLVAA